jgi:phosphohistidine phosphatase
MAVTRTLYLVRHAVAEERGPAWPDDAKRPLSADGADRMRRAVRGLDRLLDVPIDRILTSPLTRALQTAEILAEGLRAHPDVVEFEELTPGTPSAAVARALTAVTRLKGLALVGHEPDLGRLAAWLLGTRTPPPFKKGAVCRIDAETWPPDRGSRLIWFVTPRMLRRLAG